MQTPKGAREIGPGYPCFVIAELSANHNGNFDKAVEIIRAAAASGADAVKIQTYTPDTMTIDSDKRYFMVGDMIGGEDNPDTWKGMSLYALYQKAQTPYAWHADLKKITEELGMVFFSTPYEETAVDFLEGLGVPLYKVASYETTHIPFLKRVAKTGKPVIMSVGFSTLQEIELAVETLRSYGTKDIVLLHCTTAYSKSPKPEDANLKTMLDLRERFGTVVGFSDNNTGTEIPLQAVMMGASVLEKHMVASTDDKVIDGDFSLGPDHFKALVHAIRKAESALGEVKYGVKCKAEQDNAKYQRSIFAVREIKKGDTFNEENMRVIRPRFGLEPKYYEEIIGKMATQDIERGTPLMWDMIQK
ncbi:MAG: pseudaminic acid synthase [Candidatus Magasanikbacteria bacterium]|nr:pseudaminic acid synthase [Candidatus Magasanikbacteria bacterium]